MARGTSKYNNEEINNVYAFNLQDEEIHISKAQSGRKGYYCLGCKREMQAVISTIADRISYFRHDAKAVKGQVKCTYSDETYRHKIAKEILSRLKSIKIPAVYKYPPNGNEGKAILLADGRLIEADSVGIERSFYEDENGQIHCQKNGTSIDEKYLLIRPDVTFFDANGKPILFIEIVVTHKITDEKRIKLKRLGINTVQIRIPKDSPQEIEKSFFNTQYIKWLYNDEEQRTEYISIPKGSSEGIPPIDEEQRKLFAESVKCRTAQINNLIRTINRCLESKLYRDTERGLESELSRVEGNTERARGQLSKLQEGIKLDVEGSYRERREQLRERKKEFITEERKFQKYTSDLERRYLAKREFSESEIRRTIEEIGGNGQSFETRRRNLEMQAARVDGDIRNGRNRIERIKREREETEKQLQRNFESIAEFEKGEINRISTIIDELPIKFEKLESDVRTEFKYFEETERREIEEFTKFENEFDSNLEQGRIELERKFEGIREGIIKSIKTRDAGGNTEFTRKLKDLIKNGTLLIHLEEIQFNFRRYKKAWGCFKEGAYKNWN